MTMEWGNSNGMAVVAEGDDLLLLVVLEDSSLA